MEKWYGVHTYSAPLLLRTIYNVIYTLTMKFWPTVLHRIQPPALTPASHVSHQYPICNEHEIKQEDSHTQSLMKLVYGVQLSC